MCPSRTVSERVRLLGLGRTIASVAQYRGLCRHSRIYIRGPLADKSDFGCSTSVIFTNVVVCLPLIGSELLARAPVLSFCSHLKRQALSEKKQHYFFDCKELSI